MLKKNNKQYKEGFEEGVYIGRSIVKNPIELVCFKSNKVYNNVVLAKAGKGMNYFHKLELLKLVKGGN